MAVISEATCNGDKEGEQSIERGAFSHTAQSGSWDIEQQSPRTPPTISPSFSNRPSPSPLSMKMDSSQPLQMSTIASRTLSYSLLSSSLDSSVTSRKSKFADSGTTSAVGKGSISMPPPIMKPPNHKPPISGQSMTNVTTGDTLASQSGSERTIEGKIVTDPASMEDVETIRKTSNSHGKISSDSGLRSDPIKPVNAAMASTENDAHRLSFSSLYSLGSVVYSAAAGGSSAPSSNAESVKSAEPIINTLLASSPLGSAKLDPSSATTATDPISVIANSRSPHAVPFNSLPSVPSTSVARSHDPFNPDPLSRPMPAVRRSRSRTKRQSSSSNVASITASPNNSERSSEVRAPPIGTIGICALDVKARSKASRNILTRLQSNGDFDVVVFGDKVILDEDVENWPLCDFLIAFFSDGFPLEKAIAYAKLRNPFCINDLPMQKVLWDRRICLRILDYMGVPTPNRVEVNRDGGPMLESADLADHVFQLSGVRLEGPPDGTGGGMPVTKDVRMIEDGDTLLVDGTTLRKPFVEKPISGEDHNIFIYFPKSYNGGGGRRLFRKVGNKSSEWDERLILPRAITEEGSSYVYEQFLHVDNAEDIKAYTVGPDFCHAETRKSPVVDGLVRRNTHGKEIRYMTSLTKEESVMAAKIANGFGQRICGFDLLRAGHKSYVIDVNGWSFVKDNNEYYDKCASILKNMFLNEKLKQDGLLPNTPAGHENHPDKTTGHRRPTGGSHRWELKSMVTPPGISKFTGQHLSSHRQPAPSPELSANVAPGSSRPSDNGRSSSTLPTSPRCDSDQLSSQSNPTEPHDGVLEQPAPGPGIPLASIPRPASKHSWKLKGVVAVIRHADRTPKQKFKFTFHTQPFIDLLKGHEEEVLLKGEGALNSVMNAVNLALRQGEEDPEKLQILKTALARKGSWTGTKVQIKPMFRKRKEEEEIILNVSGEAQEISASNTVLALNGSMMDPKDEPTGPPELASVRNDSSAGITLSRFSAAENDLILDKLQLIIKWGGEPTHAARYQSHDLGENMRNDLLLLNKEILDDVRVFTSSERRVSTSAQIWAASFLNQKEMPADQITVRKDLLDDSNAAKDVMDKVKKKLKLLLREGHQAPPQFAWPANTPEPAIVVRKVVDLMVFHRRVMRHNFQKLNIGAAASLTALNKLAENSNPNTGSFSQATTVANIQGRWCSGEDADLFKERWEKLFAEFCDSDKVDPSKISELYDSMKFDALHNRQFLEYIFTPSKSILAEHAAKDTSSVEENNQEQKPWDAKPERIHGHKSESFLDKLADKAQGNNLAHLMGLRRKTELPPPSNCPGTQEEYPQHYFKLFSGCGETRAKQDARLEKLRELYKLTKVLFDFVCPQEYGISDEEKLEIGLLTSLPLLKEIVKDLEEVQASEDAKSFIYFTKESHIYTLLNCILEGGIKTKIARNAIPELDYLSTISFELYEAEDKEADTFAYSIRIAISPGCHTIDPLDVQLDSKHSIGCAPKRSLTPHLDWKEVIETLRAKFHTVKLPKSFLAVNVSESHAMDASSSVANSAASSDIYS